MKRSGFVVLMLGVLALTGCGGGDSTDREAALTTSGDTTSGEGGGGSSTKEFGSPPGVTVSKSAARRAKDQSIKEIINEAKPLPIPKATGINKREKVKSGKTKRIRPANPKSGKVPLRAKQKVPNAAEPETAPPRGKSGASASATQNGYWPYSYNSNPNRQVGKLYFDVTPGAATKWSSCSATAVNSENKSVVWTAGHCVFNQPQNSPTYTITGNGYWYEQVQFCPGFENQCNLGVWYARKLYSTNGWVYGIGGKYNWQDDVAAVLVSPNSKGSIVNVVGGQGIAFNLGTSQYRRSFGYPAPDYRFPAYSYSGVDMAYCAGYDTYDGYGRMDMPCTMTGGASGGPWIINPNASWLGTLNGVNSHKKSGPLMGSPYFGTAESSLFQYVRNR